MKSGLKIAIWSCFSIAVIVLLFFANNSKGNTATPDPIIKIKESPGMSFLTEAELKMKLRRANLWSDNLIFDSLKLNKIENFISKMNEVESVQVYSNLGETWNIDIQIRRPIVRVLPKGNSGFYIDDKGDHMAVSKFPAHVLVATGLDNLTINSLGYNQIINNDSLITIKNIDDLYRISRYVCNNTFFNAQLTQVHYDKNDGFILIPRVGNHKIIFGNAKSHEDVEEKFKKLKLFYTDVIPYEGWDKYKSIDLRFNKQIVGKKN